MSQRFVIDIKRSLPLLLGYAQCRRIQVNTIAWLLLRHIIGRTFRYSLAIFIFQNYYTIIVCVIMVYMNICFEYIFFQAVSSLQILTTSTVLCAIERKEEKIPLLPLPTRIKIFLHNIMLQTIWNISSFKWVTYEPHIAILHLIL